MRFIFKTSATMKDYNRGKWWIDEEDDSPFNLKELCKRLEKAFDDKGIWDMAIKDWVL